MFNNNVLKLMSSLLYTYVTGIRLCRLFLGVPVCWYICSIIGIRNHIYKQIGTWLTLNNSDEVNVE